MGVVGGGSSDHGIGGDRAAAADYAERAGHLDGVALDVHVSGRTGDADVAIDGHRSAVLGEHAGTAAIAAADLHFRATAADAKAVGEGVTARYAAGLARTLALEGAFGSSCSESQGCDALAVERDLRSAHAIGRDGADLDDGRLWAAGAAVAR